MPNKAHTKTEIAVFLLAVAIFGFAIYVIAVGGALWLIGLNP